MNRFNKTKDIEITGNMDLGAYSPLELAEEQQLNEISNRLLANYMEKAKSMDRERQYDVAKKHAIDTINQKYRDFMVRDLTWPDRAYYKFSVDFKDGYGFIIEVYYMDTVDSRNNYVLYLTPERPLYQIDGSYIGQDTPVGYMLKNMRAGERMKFKELCKEANELNGNSEETLNEADRHRSGYYADYAKRTGKKDRHKKGYYKKYNKEHPERLNRGYTKGYKGGCIDNGPIGGTQDDEIIGYDMLGRPITKDPFLDKLRNKTEFEWYDEDWDEGGYMDVHESVTKQNSLRSMIREGLAELAGEQFTHQLGPDGDVVYGKDEQGFFVYIKKNLSVKYFDTPEEAEEYARKVYKAIRLRKNAERQEFDKQMSLDETIQKHVVDVMKRYTDGNASADEANKAIMDLADSGAKKTNKVNESDANTKYVLYADTTKSGNSDFISYTNDGIKKGNIKYLLKYLPEESILDESDKEKKPVSRKDIEKKYEVALEKDGYLVVWINGNKKQDIRVYKKQTKMNESFEDEYAKMNELAKDEFYITLKQLVSIVKEDSIIDAAEAVDDYPAVYCVYGSEPEYEGKLSKLRTSITKSVIRTLYNYDVVCADDETLTVNVEQSNVPQAAELCIKLQQLSQQTPINESYTQDGNYTHFAVHKGTNKIVNGWDYSGYDPEELKMYKNDYFTQDLIDYELDPKQYTILTVKGCKARGIDPYDDSQWANGYELNEKSGEGIDPYYSERHDMENKKIENMGNMNWSNFKK